jgi:hypothetical protein
MDMKRHSMLMATFNTLLREFFLFFTDQPMWPVPIQN